MAARLVGARWAESLKRQTQDWQQQPRFAAGVPDSPPDATFVYGDLNTITFQNDFGDTVPAYAVLAVSDGGGQDADGSDFIVGDQPSADSLQYAVNSADDVEAPDGEDGGTGFGQCFLAGVCRVLYDGDDPSVGDKLGPVAGQFYASATGTPAMFTCLGVYDSDAKVMLALIGEGGAVREVTGTTTSAVTASTATFIVTVLTATDGQANPSGSSFTITNPGGTANGGYTIPSGNQFWARWDTSLTPPGYRIYDAVCAASGG